MLLATLFAITAIAETREYANTGDWIIYKQDDGCSMMTGLNSRMGGKFTFLDVRVDDRVSYARLTFNDPTVRSLKVGDMRSIKVRFLNKSGLDEGWGSAEFRVLSVNEDGATFSKRFDVEMLDDLNKGTALGFYNDDILLQAYPLRGSSSAIQTMKRCAAEVVRTNPSDPFAE